MKKTFKGKILNVEQNLLTVELSEAFTEDPTKYEVKVEKPVKHRTLDANALAWTLIDRIAEALDSSRDEIYDQMLERYGVAMYMIVKPKLAEKALRALEHGRILGNVAVGNEIGTQLQIFLGSSHYDTRRICALFKWHNF